MCNTCYHEQFTAPCAVIIITNKLQPHVLYLLPQIIFSPMCSKHYNKLFTTTCAVPLQQIMYNPCAVPLITKYLQPHVR